MYQQPHHGQGQGQGSPGNRGGFHQNSNRFGPPFAQQQSFGQQRYGQPGYQGNFQQGSPPNRGAHHSNTYPPPKRQKGNPVITRYAPPPGYQAPPTGQPWQGTGSFRGPTQGFQQPYQQPAPSFQRPSGPPSFQNGWQPQQGQFGGGRMFQSPQGYTGPSPNFPTPQQGGPQSHPPQFNQHPGYQQQQQQSSAGHPNVGNLPAGQAAPAQSGHIPHQSWQGSPPTHHSFPSKHDSFGGSPNHSTPPRQGSVGHPGRGSVGSVGSMPPPLSSTSQEHQAATAEADMSWDQTTAGAEPDPNDPLNMKEHDWTFDPEGAIWPKATDIVDNNLSLGLISWHPGTRMTRAIPHTFAAAEQFARTAPPAPIGLGDSVSTYFMIENHENAYENISVLAHWAKIARDPVFVTFPEEYESLPISEVKEWRDRADVVGEYLVEAEEEGEIGIDGDGSNGLTNSLAQARQQHTAKSHHHTTQFPGNEGQHLDGKKQFNVDQSQEDILASLGVEGPARPVYPTPGPAYGAHSAGKSGSPVEAVPQRRVSQAPQLAGNTRGPVDHPPPVVNGPSHPSDDPIEQAIARAIAGNAAQSQQSTRPPVGSTELSRSDPEPYDPWNPDQAMPVAQRPSSTHSNKTQNGSDFDRDPTEGASTNGAKMASPSMAMDEDAKPPFLRDESSASRKRSYDNFNNGEDSDDDRKRRQSGDGGRSDQPSHLSNISDDAYSRRW